MRLINTYHRPLPSENRADSFFSAVLTQDGQGNYAVYIGEGTDEWVLENGFKLCYEEALHYFPMLEESEYRR